jgi:hypothetical protein
MAEFKKNCLGGRVVLGGLEECEAEYVIGKRGIVTGVEFSIGCEFVFDQLDKLGINGPLTCHVIDPIIEFSFDEVIWLYRGPISLDAILYRAVLDLYRAVMVFHEYRLSFNIISRSTFMSMTVFATRRFIHIGSADF